MYITWTFLLVWHELFCYYFGVYFLFCYEADATKNVTEPDCDWLSQSLSYFVFAYSENLFRCITERGERVWKVRFLKCVRLCHTSADVGDKRSPVYEIGLTESLFFLVFTQCMVINMLILLTLFSFSLSCVL